MKLANLVFASALLVGSAVVVAVAQPAAPAGAPPGGGRGALQAACGADITANCADAGRGVRQCLTDNQAKLSAGCKTALANLPARGPGGAPPAGGAAP